jgi:uncharacterized protein YebE (UPF0316 family)
MPKCAHSIKSRSQRPPLELFGVGVVQMKEYLGNRTEICDLLTFNVEFSMGIALLLIMKIDISVYNGFMWLNIADKKR